MKCLVNAAEALSIVAPEAQIGTVAAVIAAFAAVSSALVALYALRRTEAREHHRWLQEKRREAYVEFLNATRNMYEAISKHGNLINAADLLEDYPNPESEELVAANVEIDEKQAVATRALDLLVIVGPDSMITAGRRVMARLRLDRVYYSPTRWTQLGKHKARVMEYAEGTGDASLLLALKGAYAQGPVNLEEYRRAHRDHRLENFWGVFTHEAQKVLKDPTPDQSITNETLWSHIVTASGRNV